MAKFKQETGRATSSRTERRYGKLEVQTGPGPVVSSVDFGLRRQSQGLFQTLQMESGEVLEGCMSFGHSSAHRARLCQRRLGADAHDRAKISRLSPVRIHPSYYAKWLFFFPDLLLPYGVRSFGAAVPHFDPAESDPQLRFHHLELQEKV